MKIYISNISIAIVFFLMGVIPFQAFSQAIGDNFQSNGTGNWNSVNTWQEYYGGAWHNPANHTPTSSDGTIAIQNGHNITITANVTIDRTNVKTGGTITINASKTLTIAAGVSSDLSVSGTIVSSGNIVTTGSLSFLGGGTYKHAQDGGIIPTATWDVASNCIVTGVTANPITSGLGQVFGNFTWNCAQTTNLDLGNALTTISGNFTVLQTGNTGVVGNTLHIKSNTSSLTIGGDFITSGNTSINFNYGSSATSTINIGGNLNLAGYFCFTNNSGSTIINLKGIGKTINISTTNWLNSSTGPIASIVNFHVYNGASYTLNTEFDVPGSNSITIDNGGTLNTGTNIITDGYASGGTFTNSAGGTLGIGSSAGITTSGVTGNIQTTNRVYSTGSNYNYNGTVAQVTGSGLTVNIPANVTLGNIVNTVTLSANTTISGTLTINSSAAFSASSYTLNVGGNWFNNGTFTSSTSTVNFNGSAAQSIGDSVATTFNNLTINNTYSTADQITLGSNVTVNNTLTLTKGIVNPNRYTFLLAAGATTTTGSASSYIDGPVSYAINTTTATTLNFPIGNGANWRPVSLALKYSVATAHTYTVQLYNGDANSLGFALASTITLASHVHYYKISTSVASSPVPNLTSANITLYYSTTNGANDFVTDYKNLGIVESTGSSSPWIDISKSGGGTANGTGSIASKAITSFGYISLANEKGGSNTLPIDLISYKIKCVSTGSLFTWTTASEINNAFFTIEKTEDLLNWEIISTISGAFNSNIEIEYSAIDSNMVPDKTIYYRLKQTDVNGQYKYFDVLAILCKFKNDVLDIIGINASDNGINLIIKTEGLTPVQIYLHDMSGKQITQNEINPKKGANIVSLSVHGIANGIYIANIVQDGKTVSKKIYLGTAH